jgi:outer membrane protein assembly factor BamB
VWKSLNEKATASSPVLADIDGKPRLFVITRTAIHSLDPETGNDYWSLPTRKQTTGDLYAASPVIFGNFLFVSGCYRLGAELFQLENDRPKKLWHLDDSLSTHLANAIHEGGYLYGFHGHAGLPEGRTFRCIEVATGKVMWEETLAGSGTVLRAGANLLILLETGQLELAKATPKGLQVLSRAQVVGRPVRNYPAIADGYAFIKGPNTLVCLDLRKRK